MLIKIEFKVAFKYVIGPKIIQKGFFYYLEILPFSIKFKSFIFNISKHSKGKKKLKAHEKVRQNFRNVENLKMKNTKEEKKVQKIRKT